MTSQITLPLYDAAREAAATAPRLPAHTPDLGWYDWILVNSSAGKDSQAMLDRVIELADAAGVARDRIVVVHADLGRAEWAGTRALAAEQAAHYGLRFETVRRAQGDLLDQVEQRHARLQERGKDAAPWPDSVNRWCTSDQKRGQVRRLMTALASEWRAAQGGKPSRPARILNAMGMRAGESSARARLAEFEHDRKASNGRRHVDTWLPVHGWTADEVWTRIRAAGTRHHWAYDVGMSRLSCVFCIFAPRAQLLLAAEHNRALLDEYVGIEDRTGYSFRHRQSLREVRDALEAGERGSSADDGCWGM